MPITDFRPYPKMLLVNPFTSQVNRCRRARSASHCLKANRQRAHHVDYYRGSRLRAGAQDRRCRAHSRRRAPPDVAAPGWHHHVFCREGAGNPLNGQGETEPSQELAAGTRIPPHPVPLQPFSRGLRFSSSKRFLPIAGACSVTAAWILRSWSVTHESQTVLRFFGKSPHVFA